MSWFKIFIFYLAFYLALFAFFFLMLFIALLTMPANEPKYKDRYTLFGTEPGLSFIPMFKEEGSDQRNNQIFDFLTESGDMSKKAMEQMAKQMTDYFESVDKIEGNDCVEGKGPDFTVKDTARADKKGNGGACKVHTPTGKSPGLDWGKCGVAPYGWKADKYKESENFKPCIIIKVNRMWGWKPPKAADKDKKARVAETNGTKVEPLANLKIWCKATKEKGSIDNPVYYPSQYISGNYFPYLRQKSFTSPFIIVQLSNLKVNKKSGLLEVVCKIEKGASVKFQFKLGKIK